MATAEKKTFHHIFDVNELQSENLTIGVLGCGAFGEQSFELDLIVFLPLDSQARPWLLSLPETATA